MWDVFLLSFSWLLKAPADLSICSVLPRRIREKMASFRRWADWQCNSRSGWGFRLLLLLVLCVQADASIHACVAFVSEHKSDMLKMQKCVLQTAHDSLCFLFCYLYLTGPRGQILFESLFAKFSFPAIQLYAFLPICRCEARQMQIWTFLRTFVLQLRRKQLQIVIIL